MDPLMVGADNPVSYAGKEAVHRHQAQVVPSLFHVL